jgi:hypothetical protein
MSRTKFESYSIMGDKNLLKKALIGLCCVRLTMDVLKKLSVPIFLIVALVAVVNTGEAKPQSTSLQSIITLVTNPCDSEVMIDFQGAPDGVICVKTVQGTVLRSAINIPVPKIVDKEPELSIVGIPTYFTVTWDGGSFAYTDSNQATYEWVVSGERNRLTGVRTELRIYPVQYDELMGNVKVSSANNRLEVMAEGGIDAGPFTRSKACLPGWEILENSLITVPWNWGGWARRSTVVCNEIKDDLDQGSFDNLPGHKGDGKEDEIDTYSIAGRYPEWNANTLLDDTRYFGAFSESASISGTGSINGIPAYQINLETYIRVEARIMWDWHEVYMQVSKSLSCEWEYYYSGYDIIDWTQLPDSPFCRYVYKWDWVKKCKPENCSEGYGLRSPDAWWIPIGETSYSGDTVLFDKGSGYQYEDAVDIVVIQAQPLLVEP